MTTSTPAPEHHHVIRAAESEPVLQTPEFTVGFLGVRTRVTFEIGMMPGYVPPREPRMVTPLRPAFDEEYFEWIDVLEAVAEAGADFVMVELGAGYGRWLMRGAAAARRRGGCSFHGIGVEAEPDHFRWLRQHFRDNDVDPGGLDLVWAAIGPRPGFVPFWIGDSDAWYGQAVAHRSAAPLPDLRTRRVLRARSALGRPPALSKSGQTVVWVPCTTLDDLLAPYPRVDLMDLDIQGLELEVLSSSIDLVDARVRRVHIGTHSSRVEDGLRELFTRHGWQNVNDYACRSRVLTPYGEIAFGDGVQTWLNPKIAATPAHAAAPGQTPRTVASPTEPAPAARDNVLDSSRPDDVPVSRMTRLVARNQALRAKNDHLRKERDIARQRYRALRERLAAKDRKR